MDIISAIDTWSGAIDGDDSVHIVCENVIFANATHREHSLRMHGYWDIWVIDYETVKLSHQSEFDAILFHSGEMHIAFRNWNFIIII